jgi:hypothetical protein
VFPDLDNYMSHYNYTHKNMPRSLKSHHAQRDTKFVSFLAQEVIHMCVLYAEVTLYLHY